MNWFHLLIAFVPNLLIIILSFLLAEVAFEITIPNLLEVIKKESNSTSKFAIQQKDNLTTGFTNNNAEEIYLEKNKISFKYTFFLYLLQFIKIISLISFLLFIWCWITAATIDPGSVINDLKHRKIKVYNSNGDNNALQVGKENTQNCNSYNYLKNRSDNANINDNFNSNQENFFYCDALSLIRNGKIPYCLQNLPFCEICKVPRPPGAVHCSVCRCCILRCDHHCAILGQCVGDRNIKCFFLSFLYSAIFCFSHFTAALWYLLKTPDDFLSLTNIIIFIFSVYSIIGGFSLICFDVSFFIDFSRTFLADDDNKNNQKTSEMNNTNTNISHTRSNPIFSCNLKIKRFWLTLGNNWFERLLPIHNKTTDFAWKDVCWNSDNFL
ncbi:palmitoyltransferase swf1 [Tritrichomonas musculus]|uniref:Palmitoyltransferase n=1 Tax=Tritrichomonas musculus TaxID=1915356 RepID=A0ABR2K7C7_9EUKA